MRAGWLLLFAFFVAADATSQTSIGVVTGIVSDPEGAPFANAFVQLTATGASSPAANAVSGADGRYTLTAVATGTYELAVNVPGMKSFTRSNLVLTTGATLRVDAQLEDAGHRLDRLSRSRLNRLQRPPAFFDAARESTTDANRPGPSVDRDHDR